MRKEMLEQAVLDYIGEKFKDKVVDKRVQTFFTYSELVDTVLSFAELLNKNIEELKIQNTNANIKGLEMQVAKDSHRDRANKTQEQLTKATRHIEKIKYTLKKIIETVHNDNIDEYGRRLVLINDFAYECLQEIEK